MISDSTFRRLRLFESPSLVKGKYFGLHRRSPSSGMVKSITTSIAQGRELFATATSSSFTTRPILQYYGVAALARAIALFLTPGKAEAALTPSHGLSISEWPITPTLSLKDLTVKVDRGLFTEMLAAADHGVYRANSSAANYSLPYDPVPVGSEIELEFAFSLFPDCWLEFEEWTGKKMPWVEIKEIVPGADSTSWRVQVNDSSPDPATLFDGAEVELHEKWDKQEATITKGDWVPQIAQSFSQHWNIGDILIVPPVKGAAYRLSPLAAFFATSYFLGMLARYRPSIWISLWQGSENNAISPLLSRYMEVLERWFPEMAADILSFGNKRQ